LAREVGYFTSDSNMIIHASVDMDFTDEFKIRLTGLKTLTAADFML
jgi:hypothetical protein